MRISDEPLINQARERFALQDYYGAIHLLQDIVESGRSFADCHHLLGLCFAMPLSSGFPATVAANLANQHATLAAAYAESGAMDQAIEQYRRAVALGPNFADIRYKLARALLEHGDVLSAGEELARVVADRPNFVDARASLGLARYLSGDAIAAQQIWRDCLVARPKNARVEAYLAMLERASE